MGERWESMGWFWRKSSRVRVVPRSYLPSHTHSPASMSLHKASPSLLTTLPSVTQPRRLPRATYFTPPRARSHLPTHAPHTPLTPAKEPGEKKKKKSSGKPPALPRPLQHAPLPPPPSTFEKCLQKGEYFLSLVSTWPTQPGQSLPARAGVPSPLCSAVPARLCPQTSIVHYRR